MWDNEGHIITNYHVIASILSTVPKGRSVGEVAKAGPYTSPLVHLSTFQLNLEPF